MEKKNVLIDIGGAPCECGCGNMRGVILLQFEDIKQAFDYANAKLRSDDKNEFTQHKELLKNFIETFGGETLKISVKDFENMTADTKEIN